VNLKPEILVIGTGYSGAMVVPEETISFLESHNIEVYVALTEKATELFNKFQKERRAVAAFHLTC